MDIVIRHLESQLHLSKRKKEYAIIAKRKHSCSIERREEYNKDIKRYSDFIPQLEKALTILNPPIPTEQQNNDKPALGMSDVSNNEAVLIESLRNFIRSKHLSAEWENFLKESEVAVCPICKTPRPPHYQGEGSCESCAQ